MWFYHSIKKKGINFYQKIKSMLSLFTFRKISDLRAIKANQHMASIAVIRPSGAFIDRTELIQFASEYYDWSVDKPALRVTNTKMVMLISLTGLYHDYNLIKDTKKGVMKMDVPKELFLQLILAYAEKCKFFRQFVVPDSVTGRPKIGKLPDPVHERLAERMRGTGKLTPFKDIISVIWPSPSEPD